MPMDSRAETQSTTPIRLGKDANGVERGQDFCPGAGKGCTMSPYKRRFSSPELSPNRQFQVWSYAVSHSWLLLRSNKTDVISARIEILFHDVAAMQLPTVIDDLTIRKEDATADSTTRLLDGLTSMWQPDSQQLFTGHSSRKEVFRLCSGGRSGMPRRSSRFQ